jgi:hypothetical protein
MGAGKITPEEAAAWRDLARAAKHLRKVREAVKRKQQARRRKAVRHAP